MKYLCLGYYDEAKFDALSPEEVKALVSQCGSRDAELRATGKVLSTSSLGPTAATRSIRPRSGKPVVTDGPFAETKEVIGAFFIVEASDMNDAVRLASKHPAAQLGENVGWGIEVRPIEHYLT